MSDKQKLEFLLDLCSVLKKHGLVQFGYTSNDDGCTIDLDGHRVIERMWGSDDVEKEIKHLQHQTNAG